MQLVYNVNIPQSNRVISKIEISPRLPSAPLYKAKEPYL